MRHRPLLMVIIVALAQALLACGGGDPDYEAWSAAREAFEEGNYESALTQLKAISGTPSIYNREAAALRVILHSAMNRAYMELAQACEKAERDRTVPSPPGLSTALVTYRKGARSHALDLAEATEVFIQSMYGFEKVPLDFPLPEGSLSPSPVLARVSKGVFSTNTRGAMEAYTMRRGILLEVTNNSGAGGNLSTAKGLFKHTPVVVPKEVFLVGLGRSLLEAAALFGPQHLDNSARHEVLLEKANQCLGHAVESKNVALREEAQHLQLQIKRLLDRSAA